MIQVKVTQLTREAEGILGIELRAEDGTALVPFEPGAHIDVHLASGLTRQYSLCNDASETDRYRLGVGLSATSRGGSSYLHTSLREGDLLTISEPRTLFGLSREATSHRFIAGGIGITPILSMIRWCVRQAVPWHLHYCVRSRMCAAYLDELRAFGGKVHVHANDESASGTPDIQTLIGDIKHGEHVYCCGPGGLMDAVSHHGQQSGIPRENLHFERFTASPVQVADGSERAFTIVLARLGMRCAVEPSESILESLERHSVCPPFSCREGLCRSCEVGVLSGEVEHRDYVLSEHEQRSSKSLMICVSRAKSDELVIDL
ncbi:PDR/VanB family oxidoreductase [Paraburkholderia sp. SEWSISQ10-3 4]|nr:PDR/VanB family oxidoreductase [Paraburkholderia sp. SEWSISQ10-3 4]MCX4137136.1 PDR/VanB family oxidoreductase [Paraburkholderia aspalathi]MDN7169828.1 PDR/VanB family oxidoreductase [Paraburkholderia sp. SEWSISQ10-3 4]MDQ6499467.1 PDR/VanB family oxidoreductase [Paraburkholderia aspalathi]